MECIGAVVRKCFPGHGWFQGEVVEVIQLSGRCYFRVEYDDGDVEDVSEAELKKILVDGSETGDRPEGQERRNGLGNAEAHTQVSRCEGPNDYLDSIRAVDNPHDRRQPIAQSAMRLATQDVCNVAKWQEGQIRNTEGKVRRDTVKSEVAGLARKPSGNTYGSSKCKIDRDQHTRLPNWGRKGKGAHSSRSKKNEDSIEGYSCATDQENRPGDQYQHQLVSAESGNELRAHPNAEGRGIRTPGAASEQGKAGKDSQAKAAPSEMAIKQEFFGTFRDSGVPRRKRSDLGVAIVRMCPGFAIRDLPRMYEEFQRANVEADHMRQCKDGWPMDPSLLRSCYKHHRRKRPRHTVISLRYSGIAFRRPPTLRSTIQAGKRSDVGPVQNGIIKSRSVPRPPNYSCMREMFAKRQRVNGLSRSRSGHYESFQSFLWNGEDNVRAYPSARVSVDTSSAVPCDHESDGGPRSVAQKCKTETGLHIRDSAGPQPSGQSITVEASWRSRPGVCNPHIPKMCAPKASQIIAVLMRDHLLTLGEKLQYKTKPGQVLAEGWVTWHGILCSRCGGVVGPTGFERCAGSLARRPCDHIFTPSAHSLHSLSRQLGLGHRIDGSALAQDEAATQEVVVLDDVSSEMGLTA